MERNIIGGRYQILQNLYEDASYCASLGRDINARESAGLYILNIYRDSNSRQKAAPVYTRINSNTCRYFVEFFVDSSDLVSVFTYSDSEPLAKYLERQDLTVKSRLNLCSDFLLELVRNDNIPLMLKISLMKHENIVVDSSGHILLNFLVLFENGYVAYTPEPELEGPYYEAVWSIMSLILGNEKKLDSRPKQFLSRVKACDFDRTGTLYSEFRALAELLIAEADAEGKSLEQKAKGIGSRAAKRFLKIPSPVVFLRIFIAVMIIGLLSAGGYFIYRFILESSINADSVQASAETEIRNNAKLVGSAEKEPTVQPAQAVTPQPTAAPQLTATPAQTEEYETYTVKTGDTLNKIAKAFYGSSDKYTLIMKANNLTSHIIHEGTKLKIPKQ